MSKGIGGHQSAKAKTVEWLTPPEILHSLGRFDLDPCSPIQRPWDTADTHYTKVDDGLLLPWFGRVWLNPPYGTELIIWLKKMSQHLNGIALTFARTEADSFQKYVFPVADSIFFIDKRLAFWTPAGNKATNTGGAPSVLIGYGEENVEAIEHSGIKGHHVFLNCTPVIVVGINETWQGIVSVALMRRDGEAALAEVYKIVERIAPGRVTTNKHYKEKVRQTLQKHFTRVRKGYYTSRKPVEENLLFG